MDAEVIKIQVRHHYADRAKKQASNQSECCKNTTTLEKLVERGYSSEEASQIVVEAVEAFAGCGNPVAIAGLKPGEIVLDIGSGGGLDAFLASKRVGPMGRVIGIDTTPEMITLAKKNAEKMGVRNAEFRLGEAEALPVEDKSVDIVMSNCVICLIPDKEKVFQEIARVLKPSGRVVIADELAAKPFKDKEKGNPKDWCRCITGAITEKEYYKAVEKAGLTDIKIRRLYDRIDDKGINPNVYSVLITAKKS